MNIHWLNVGLGFIEGIALIVSPCILPILPIILAGSLTGTKARPYGIITGFITAFTLVTLFSRSLVTALHITPDVLRNVSFVILILLGIVMISNYLSEKLNVLTGRLMNFGSQFQNANNTESGFLGGFFFGSFVSIIWTPCAGPILAAVIVQIVLQKTTFNSLLVLAAFALGAAIPMFLIVLLGRKIIEKTSFLRNHSLLLRKIFGLIIIASAVFIFFNPTFGSATSTNENEQTPATITTPATPTPVTTNQNDNAILDTNQQKEKTVTTNDHEPIIAGHLKNGLDHVYAAPPIDGITAWINTKPLTIEALRGKVVLIDFWTYSCINCIRTFPYLKDWYAKYHDKGFVIIGVHSPEFAFEQDLSNVQAAVKKFGITYPVALDNRFVTWQNFSNSYWPAHYLIDKSGNVVYQHFGEGEYATTENNIRVLLGLKSTTIHEKTVSVPSRETPEIYLGYSREEQFAGEHFAKGQVKDYHYPEKLPLSTWALQGKWKVLPDKIIAMDNNAVLKLHYYAKNVYAVIGNADQQTRTIEIKDRRGQHTINITQHQLYTLITQSEAKEGELEIIAKSPGVELYTFTFGA